jgi:cytochrome bd-type quinol oxidase subunit 2
MPVVWRWDANPTYLIGAVGGLFLIIGECHRPGSPFGRIYRLWGMLISGVVLAILSFHRSNDRFYGGWDAVLSGFAQTGIILVATTLTLTIGVLLNRREVAANPFGDRLKEFQNRQWLPVSIPVVVAFMASWQALWGNLDTSGTAAIVPTILANLALLAASFWLLRIGLHEERGFPFAAGVGMFLLWTVMRYIDLFGDVGGMIGASCMFFLCGASLFGVALYWRKRKEA